LLFFHISLLCCCDQWLWGFCSFCRSGGNEIASKCLPLLFSAPPLFLWPLRGVLHVRVWVVLCAAKVEVFNELKFGTCVLGMDGKTSEICYTKLWLWRLWLCTALMRSAQRMRLCALRFNDGFASFQGISHLAMMAIKWLNHATSLSLSNGKHVN